MNSKISLPDLINALATQSGAPRTSCERFVKTMFSIIASRLTSGENVKVKGLGTFKVSDVEERKSVNVNTGAEMVIPGHRKVTFTPDKSLAETINQPFAMFEAVELDEAITEEILSTAESSEDTTPLTDNTSPAISESAETSMPDTQPSEQHPEEPSDKSADDNEMNDIVEEKTPEVEDVPTRPIQPQPTEKDPWEEAVEEQFFEPAPLQLSDNSRTMPVTPPTAPETEEPEHQQGPEATESAETKPLHDDREEIIEVDKPNGKEKMEIHVHPGTCHAPRFRKGVYIGMFIAAGCIILLAIGWRLLLPDSFCRVTGTVLPASNIHLSEDAIEATPIDTTAERLAANSLPETARIQPEPSADTIDPAPTKESDKAKTDSVRQETKVYDTITTKRFLTTMAKEHYGSYHLWPYIYDENASKLGHPDRIKPGTKVVIPPASKYGIDAHNPDCIAKAKRRGAAIYARYNK